MSQFSGIVTTGAQLALDSLLIRPKRAVGPMVMQVTISEQHQDDMEITDHPVEQGATISDHAFKRPASVVIKGAWSSSPSNSGLIDGVLGGLKATITGAQQILSGTPATNLPEVYEKLLKLQAQAIPFDIYTGKRAYKNMLIIGLTVETNSSTENSLLVTVNCREVQIVSTSLLPVPTDTTRQANPKSTNPVTPSGTKSLIPSSFEPQVY